jgi:hypothetical protein
MDLKGTCSHYPLFNHGHYTLVQREVSFVFRDDIIESKQFMTDFAGYGGCQNALAINVESLTSSVSVRFRTGLPEIVPEVFLKYMPSSVLTDEHQVVRWTRSSVNQH